MQRIVTLVALSLMSSLVVGCTRGRYDPVSLPIPTNVTRIDVKSSDGRVLKQLDSSADIQRVLGFLRSHRSGWRYSESGYPTPSLELFFYRGDQLIGRFGACRIRTDCGISAAGWFESDLSHELYGLGGILASAEDLEAFLRLVGMPEYSLAIDEC